MFQVNHIFEEIQSKEKFPECDGNPVKEFEKAKLVSNDANYKEVDITYHIYVSFKEFD